MDAIRLAKGYGRGKKVFINVCSHPAIGRPLDQKGDEMPDEAPFQYVRSVPLLVGLLRSMKDHSERDCHVTDVIVNPVVLTWSSRHEKFKTDVVELSLQWTEDEHKMKLSRGWKCIKSVYKGGEGKYGIRPIPFPVDIAKQQIEAGQALEAASSTTNDAFNGEAATKGVSVFPIH